MFKKKQPRLPEDVPPETLKLAAELEVLAREGEDIVDRAVTEALDYFDDVIENMSDVEWRRMVLKQHSLEIGIGKTIADKVIPRIYQEMGKSMSKKLRIRPEAADVLQSIFIGRVVKNVRKELYERDSK